MIASEFDVFEHMFDVIVNEVQKYSPKAEKQAPKPDVITIVQVKTKRRTVKLAPRFNLQR